MTARQRLHTGFFTTCWVLCAPFYWALSLGVRPSQWWEMVIAGIPFVLGALAVYQGVGLWGNGLSSRLLWGNYVCLALMIFYEPLRDWAAWLLFLFVLPLLRNRHLHAVVWLLIVCAMGPWWVAAVALAAYVVSVPSLWTLNVIRELEQARNTAAELERNRERLRIAQQLHDSLGQHLATVGLKAQVIQEVVKKRYPDDSQLLHEAESLVAVNNEAVLHLGQVVHGYRAVELESELQGAQKLLQEHGIKVQVSGSGTDFPHNNALAAWFVREAITNVVKHSDAGAVDILVEPRKVKVRNDGAHANIGPWRGLDTLASRAAAAGGRLNLSQDGEVVEVVLDFD
ncbi:sensor histidine kinase [Corynebacterium kozikiae]|uniref:sensor histidine kinase n=1 Tax=Corynebacterium kozikiae TaxID=2968469 RepID=UPI00211BC286|nr:histidine kinase [Corynebacterium sp. 76QC2CO]MCQ9344012.1 histidine kinase [Corynebacterium sp. 76QC2CO]